MIGGFILADLLSVNGYECEPVIPITITLAKKSPRKSINQINYILHVLNERKTSLLDLLELRIIFGKNPQNLAFTALRNA